MKWSHPSLNEEGYAPDGTQTIYCAHAVIEQDADGNDVAVADCEKPLLDRHHELNPHDFCSWEHWGKVGERLVLIARQTSIFFCREHSLFTGKEPNTRACPICGNECDRALPRSEVDVQGVGHFRVHEDCRPPCFDVVKNEAAKLVEANAPALMRGSSVP